MSSTEISPETWMLELYDGPADRLFGYKSPPHIRLRLAQAKAELIAGEQAVAIAERHRRVGNFIGQLSAFDAARQCYRRRSRHLDAIREIADRYDTAPEPGVTAAELEEFIQDEIPAQLELMNAVTAVFPPMADVDLAGNPAQQQILDATKLAALADMARVVVEWSGQYLINPPADRARLEAAAVVCAEAAAEAEDIGGKLPPRPAGDTYAANVIRAELALTAEAAEAAARAYAAAAGQYSARLPVKNSEMMQFIVKSGYRAFAEANDFTIPAHFQCGVAAYRIPDSAPAPAFLRGQRNVHIVVRFEHEGRAYTQTLDEPLPRGLPPATAVELAACVDQCLAEWPTRDRLTEDEVDFLHGHNRALKAAAAVGLHDVSTDGIAATLQAWRKQGVGSNEIAIMMRNLLGNRDDVASWWRLIGAPAEAMTPATAGQAKRLIRTAKGMNVDRWALAAMARFLGHEPEDVGVPETARGLGQLKALLNAAMDHGVSADGALAMLNALVPADPGERIVVIGADRRGRPQLDWRYDWLPRDDEDEDE